jgi:hypothetical protein
LQAKFLDNVLREFTDAARPRSALDNRVDDAVGNHSRTATTQRRTSKKGRATEATPQIAPPPLIGVSIQANLHPSQPLQTTTARCGGLGNPGVTDVAEHSSGPSGNDSANIAIQDASVDSYPSPDFIFSDDATWETMFANAGFNITDGTFMTDVV